VLVSENTVHLDPVEPEAFPALDDDDALRDGDIDQRLATLGSLDLQEW
jgi:hypothetical protein